MASPTAIMAEAAGVFLNDAPQSLWTSTILLPFLRRSFGDLQLALDKKNIQPLKETSSPITVNAGAVTVTKPNDFISPIKLEERALGSSDVYVLMEQKDWESNIQPVDRLRFWAYREDELKVPAATTNRQVLVYYRKGLSIPANLNDDIGIIRVENYLSAQTAGYAAKFVLQSDTRAEACFNAALIALQDYFVTQVKNNQFQGENRRHRYMSKFRRRFYR